MGQNLGKLVSPIIGSYFIPSLGPLFHTALSWMEMVAFITDESCSSEDEALLNRTEFDNFLSCFETKQHLKVLNLVQFFIIKGKIQCP